MIKRKIFLTKKEVEKVDQLDPKGKFYDSSNKSLYI